MGFYELIDQFRDYVAKRKLSLEEELAYAERDNKTVDQTVLLAQMNELLEAEHEFLNISIDLAKKRLGIAEKKA